MPKHYNLVGRSKPKKAKKIKPRKVKKRKKTPGTFRGGPVGPGVRL